jgi:hypothetical protein
LVFKEDKKISIENNILTKIEHWRAFKTLLKAVKRFVRERHWKFELSSSIEFANKFDNTSFNEYAKNKHQNIMFFDCHGGCRVVKYLLRELSRVWEMCLSLQAEYKGTLQIPVMKKETIDITN